MHLVAILAIGTIAMYLPIAVQSTWYQVTKTKAMLIAVLLTITGTLGTYLMYFVENGKFGGLSFYGAVFFVPILFIQITRWLNVRYGVLLDLCAPAECVMLAIMKVQCYLTDCCGGMQMMYKGREYIFPSQIAELVNAVIIGMMLFMMARKGKNRGCIYPWYMVMYGITRFVLNMFRRVRPGKILGMPPGNFWSLIAILVGVIWLVSMKRKTKTQNIVK